MHTDFEHRLSPGEAERQDEAQRLVDRINDQRLRANESLEYFTLHLKAGVRNVPKRRVHEPASVTNDIEERILSLLKEK